MKIGPLNQENICYVIDNLWDRGRKEAEAFGYDLPDLRQKFTKMMDKPFAGAVYDDTGECWECCALIALELMPTHFYRTHFVATETGFEKVWKPLTRFFKQFSDQIEKDYEGGIEILSGLADEKVFGWFVSMGFKLKGFDGNVHRYVKRGE